MSSWPRNVIVVADVDGTGISDTRPLTARGLELEVFSDALAALMAFERLDPVAVILPSRLPEIGVLQLLHSLRVLTGVPILICGNLPAVDAALLQTAGAAAVLPRPVSPDALLQAIRLVRLPSRMETAVEPAALAFDEQRHEISVGGTPVALTLREIDIVRRLLSRSPSLLPVEELAAALGVTAKGVRKAVAAIRSKLEGAAPRSSALIETVRGSGYRLRD